MYRYFVASWDVADVPAGSSARESIRKLRAADSSWRVVQDQEGWIALDVGPSNSVDRALRMGPDGLCFGTLFASCSGPQPAHRKLALDDDAARRIVDTRGQELIDRYWGRYVAMLRGTDGALHVVRDPTGAMNCYLVRLGAVTIVFSHLQDYLCLGATAPAINWHHVCAYLHFSRVVSRETGLEGVEQVRAGECVSVRGGNIQRAFHWHPLRIYESGIVEDRGTALRMLKEAVQVSVQSWASCYRRILLELSGGLDSSIVLACLAAAGRREDVLCFNMYTEEMEGDERAFARQVARHAGSELIEVPFRPGAKSLPDMLSAAGVSSPTMALLKSEAEDARARYSGQRNIDAIFSGQGGDNFFQRRKDSLIPGEYLRRHGIGRRLWRIVLDTSRLTGRTALSVAMDSIGDTLTRRSVDPYAVCKPPSFFCTERSDRQTQQAIRHPWVQDAARLPGCKTQQVFDIVDAQLFYAPLCDYADTVHPLVSQPIMEAVLRIPCYVLTSGGRERALVRDAFATSLPAEVIARTSKGAANGYFHNLVLNNAAFIRESLLDGALVREGLFDRARLESELTYGALLRGKELGSVLHAVMSETWIAGLEAH